MVPLHEHLGARTGQQEKRRHRVTQTQRTAAGGNASARVPYRCFLNACVQTCSAGSRKSHPHRVKVVSWGRGRLHALSPHFCSLKSFTEEAHGQGWGLLAHTCPRHSAGPWPAWLCPGRRRSRPSPCTDSCLPKATALGAPARGPSSSVPGNVQFVLGAGA